MNTKKFLLALGAVMLLSQPVWASRWDVNNDGDVTSADVTAIYDRLLAGDTSLPEINYDVNRDGSITSADITELYEVLLNGMPSTTTQYEVNGVTFVMVEVDGGTFTMGAIDGDPDANDNELPTHQVTLSSFAIGQTEVTQELWQAVMSNNPSNNVNGTNLPVEEVTWNDCQEFIAKLNEITGKNFRLPSEAEWEFAARGGNNGEDYLYAGSNVLADVAWYSENSDGSTHSVGTKAPNALGIYDMSGDVWEWCYDWLGTYSAEAQTNPEGAATGTERVLRGGSWYGKAKKCRIPQRHKGAPDFKDDDMGLRLAM